MPCDQAVDSAGLRKLGHGSAKRLGCDQENGHPDVGITKEV